MSLGQYLGQVDAVEGLDESSRELVRAIEGVLDSCRPTLVDAKQSRLTTHTDWFEVVLIHLHDPAISIEVSGFGNEVVVSYGVEHESFNVEHEDVSFQVGPLATPGLIPKVSEFLRALLRGRIELEVKHRLFYVATRSYWINDEGVRELFLRGGTVIPTLKWSTQPVVLTFDYGCLELD